MSRIDPQILEAASLMGASERQMALGLALLFGVVLPQNFDAPYRSTSLQDFLRRWHMTLSRFLRDYLYIPLGGNRGGPWKKRRYLMITMALGGLWHGAAWTYVFWGVYQGIVLVAGHWIEEKGERAGIPDDCRQFV